MPLAISTDGLYTLSKSSTVDSMATALALALHHWHWHWQWHHLTNFVFKICLSSLATIKLVELSTAWL
jgi:hypothetical protein